MDGANQYQFIGGPLDGDVLPPEALHPHRYIHEPRPGLLFVYVRQDEPQSRYVFERAYKVQGAIS